MKKFVLLGGMPRSGTTLLETVIGSNSRISIPPGDLPFAEQYAKGLSVEKIFEVLAKKSTWDLWEEKNFDALLNADHGTAFRESMRAYATKVGKDIPAAKTPYAEFFYDIYIDWLRDYDVKFVHIVRNPFDVLASLKKSHIHTNWRVFTDTLEVQAKNWQRSTVLGLARSFALPDNYFVIKYEDFVQDPQTQGSRICEFLGIEFEEERMLNRADYAYHDTNSSFADGSPETRKDSPYIYRSTSRKSFLDEAEIALVVDSCGEAAAALGYDDPDFVCRSPMYASKMKSSTRLKRKASRMVGRLFGSR
jgi:hypothetical protein